MVSVIIPVYNVAPFLREALDSVIYQSYKDLEIIIIDDGSTDDSGKICDEYKGKDKRIRVIHQVNQGLSSARNVGLDLMTGDAVVFLDSDDKLHFEFVSVMSNMMTHTQSDMVVCKYLTQVTMEQMRWDNNGVIRPSISPGIYDRDRVFQALIFGDCNVHVWNKMYRSKLWKKVRFPEGHVYEDSEIAYKIVEMCDRICINSSPLYLYRIRPGSITKTQSLKNAKDRIIAYSCTVRFIQSRVPSQFTVDQLKKMQERDLEVSISTYLSFMSSDERNRRVFITELREEIIDKARVVSISNTRAKLACQMIHYCPRLLVVVAKVYRCIKSLFLRKHLKRYYCL